MPHARHHEQTNPRRCFIRTPHRREHAVVILDAGARSDERIAPAVIHQQLAAAFRERAQIGIDGVGDSDLGRGNGLCHITIKVKRAPVPVGILIEKVLEGIDGERARLRLPKEDSPPELGPGLSTRKNLDAVPRLYRTHDGGYRIDLRSSQARSTVLAFAREDARVEPATRRILNQAIRDTVDGVAGVQHRSVDDWKLRGGDIARRISPDFLMDSQVSGVQLRSRICRRAGDDAVVIPGEALSLHQPLPPARRASIPVREARSGTVERRDDRLRTDGHLVL